MTSLTVRSLFLLLLSVSALSPAADDQRQLDGYWQVTTATPKKGEKVKITFTLLARFDNGESYFFHELSGHTDWVKNDFRYEIEKDRILSKDKEPEVKKFKIEKTILTLDSVGENEKEQVVQMVLKKITKEEADTLIAKAKEKKASREKP